MLWRTPPISRQEFEQLRARVAKLEAERAERELDLQTLMEKLRRYLLSIRQRERRDREREHESDDEDALSDLIMKARRGNHA